MNSPRSRLLYAASFALLIATNLSAVVSVNAEPAIIAKARAYLGPEAALNSVKSIHFVGKLVMVDSADPKPSETAAIDICFQTPEQQRIQATSSKGIEVTAVDGYDAWQRQQPAGDPTKWQMKLLGADQIKRLRANTWESLGFFRGIERHGGTVEDQGPVTIEGIACQKIAFTYAPNIIFYRFIETSTGRLHSTETEAGTTIREVGEQVVNGIKFPKSIVTVSPAGPGRTQTITLTFEKVTVNETFPPSLFAVPALPVK